MTDHKTSLGGTVSTTAEPTGDSENGAQMAMGFLIGLGVGIMVTVRSFMDLYPMPAGLSLWFLTIPMVVLPFLVPIFGFLVGTLVGIGAIIGLLVSLVTSNDWLPYLLLLGAALAAFAIGAVRAPDTSPQHTPWQRPPEPKPITVTEPVRSPTTPSVTHRTTTTPSPVPPTFKKQQNNLSAGGGLGAAQSPAATPNVPRPSDQPPVSDNFLDNSSAAGDAEPPWRSSKSLGGPVDQVPTPAPSTSTPTPTSTKFCSECGEPLTASAKFCPGCGYNLT